MSDTFPVQNGLKQGDRCSIANAFGLCFRICHQECPGKSEGMELNETHQLLVYDDNFNKLGEKYKSPNIIRVIKSRRMR